MIELQSLALVDGQDAQAVNLVALDGFLVELLVPVFDEGIGTGAVVLGKIAEEVEELADIGALFGQTVQGEEVVEPFGQLHQGQLAQRLHPPNERLGQHLIEVVRTEQMRSLHPVFVGHNALLVAFHQLRPCQLVVGAEQQSQGVGQYVDRGSIVQSEGFVAHDIDLGQLAGDEVCNAAYHPIGTGEDGNV